MFKEGALLGSYNGPAQTDQLISFEAPASGPPLVGRYVLLQKDNSAIPLSDWQLHVAGFLAFGGAALIALFND